MKQNQKGFAHLLLLLLMVAVIGVIGFASWRVLVRKSASTYSDNVQSSSKQSVKDTEPVIFNLGISGFGPYDNDTENAGPMELSSTALRAYQQDPNYEKPFYPFGDKLPNHQFRNPALEFHRLKHGTPVYAAMTGVVTSVHAQHSPVRDTFVDDFEITIASSSKSSWQLDYDHVQNLTVKEDDNVKVGQLVATTALNEDNTDRFEISIWKGGSSSNIITDACTMDALDSSARADFENKIAQLETDLNSFLGSKVYDLSQQNPPGCLAPTVTETGT